MPDINGGVGRRLGSCDDIGDERFAGTNPIVLQALNDLSSTWWMLEYLYNSPNTCADIRGQIRQAQADTLALANTVREIGDNMTVTKFNHFFGSTGSHFNATQHVLYASNPNAGIIVIELAGAAYMMFRGYADRDGTISNARLHAYWVATSVIETGDPGFAKMFTDAHEFGNPLNFYPDSNAQTHWVPMYQYTFMDLHNNGVGFDIGVAELERRSNRTFLSNLWERIWEDSAALRAVISSDDLKYIRTP